MWQLPGGYSSSYFRMLLMGLHPLRCSLLELHLPSFSTSVLDPSSLKDLTKLFSAFTSRMSCLAILIFTHKQIDTPEHDQESDAIECKAIGNWRKTGNYDQFVNSSNLQGMTYANITSMISFMKMPTVFIQIWHVLFATSKNIKMELAFGSFTLYTQINIPYVPWVRIITYCYWGDLKRYRVLWWWSWWGVRKM